MKKIGIITGNLKKEQTGIGIYTFELLNNFVNNEDIFTIKHSSGDSKENYESIVINFPSKRFFSLLWSIGLIIFRKKLKSFDIIHNPAQYPVLPFFGKKYIATIHDIIPILFPEMVGKIHGLAFKFYIPIILKKSTKIITDSHSTKNDIINLFSIPSSKIEVIPLGVSNIFKKYPSEEIQEFKKRYNLVKPFILFIGALEPKKNIPNLIKAFQLCLNERSDLELIIAGKKSWDYENIFTTVENLGLMEKVRFIDYIPTRDLPLLYNAAEVFVFPSLYEGFGLPPLESMKCGTPVIVSNRSSLPEIVGPLGLMVAPDDIKKICSLILKIVNDRSYRDQLSEYYLQYASNFSWEKCAQKTYDIYQELLYND